MKKIFVAVILTALCSSVSFAQTFQSNDIGSAIRQVVQNLSDNIDTGSSIAVVSMQSGSERMSNFLFDEMEQLLVNNGRGRFTTVNRTLLEHTAREIGFNLTGEVDDATAIGFGGRIGAQFVVVAALEQLAGIYVFRARMFHTQGHIIRAMYSASFPSNDAIASDLLAPPPWSSWQRIGISLHERGRNTGGMNNPVSEGQVMSRLRPRIDAELARLRNQYSTADTQFRAVRIQNTTSHNPGGIGSSRSWTRDITYAIERRDR